MSVGLVIVNIIMVLLLVYLIVILIRVYASWFRLGYRFAALDFLAKITDPYINIFAKWRISRMGNMNIAPLFALLFLAVGIQICAEILRSEQISFAVVLAIFLYILGQYLSGFAGFMAILGAIRFIGSFFRPGPAAARIWEALDHLINPMIYPIVSRLVPNRILSYRVILIFFIVMWVLIAVVASALFGFLANLSLRIPF